MLQLYGSYYMMTSQTTVSIFCTFNLSYIVIQIVWVGIPKKYVKEVVVLINVLFLTVYIFFFNLIKKLPYQITWNYQLVSWNEIIKKKISNERL